MKGIKKNRYRNYTIGLLVDPAFLYRSEQIISGVETVAMEKNINLLCFKAGDSAQIVNTKKTVFLPFDIINKKNVDGLIAMSEVMSRFSGLNSIANLFKKYYPLPIINIGLKVKNIPSVIASQEKGLTDLIAHLVRVHGKRRIALIKGPKDDSLMQALLKSYLKILQQQQLDFEPHLIFEGGFDYYTGKNAIQAFVDERKASFDAVIVSNKDVALGAILALQGRGNRVPSQVAVAVLEDHDCERDELLPLTCLRVPFFQLGRTAAELLYRQMRGEKVEKLITLPVDLIVRESCGCLSNLQNDEAVSDIFLEPKASRELKPFLTEYKKDILAKITNFHPSFGAQRKKWVKELTQELIEALTQDIINKTDHLFLVKWKEFLYHHLGSVIKITNFLNLLLFFRKNVLAGSKDPAAQKLMERIIDKAILLTSRVSEKIGMIRNIKELEQGKIIEMIGEELLMALDAGKLASIVCEKYPLIGVKSCYISLYEEAQNPLQYSRLLIAYFNKHLKQLKQKDTRFLTNRLLPLGMFPQNRRYTFFVETLIHENEPLGLVVLELKQIDLKISEFLKKRLSTAIKGVKRLEEIRIQAQNLETLVLSRTQDLSETNIQLQKEILVRLRAEEELKKSEERYRRWFEDSFTGDFIANAKGDIIACNSAFARIFGFASVKEAMQANFGDFYPNKSALEDFYTLLNVVKRIEYYEAEFLRPNGSSIHIIGNIIGSFDRSGNLIEMRGYLFDNTERKNLEEELRQSHKMEAVGRLAGGIAHDFNNLLTGIMGYSEIMLQSLSEKSPLRNEVEEIKKAAKTAASLTRQLLAFSRKQLLQPTLLNLNDVVMNMNEMLKRLIGEHIRLITKLEMDIANVKADRGQIEQVIMNLVLNSRDALPNGGDILIETKNITVTNTTAIHNPNIQNGKYVVISVSDNGIGMNQEIQSHLFEPFFTTKKEGKGVGLGLSTVYGIITQSGGYPEVMSELGRGTSVRIYLPQFGEEMGELIKVAPYPAKTKVKKTVLIVEDEQIVRDLAKKILIQAGYHVIAARNGREALFACKKIRYEIDLLLSDVIMPGMNGMELTNKLTAYHSKLKVIYMSGYIDKAIIHDAVARKGTYFIQKPFTPEVLLKKVGEVFTK
jgi:two-component system cell cycle sensor histidine kinase/response regulator CckA